MPRRNSYRILLRSSDQQLFDSLLDKFRSDCLSDADVRLMRRYLELVKKQDANNKQIRTNLKSAIKRVVLGLLVIGGGIAGVLFTFVLASIHLGVLLPVLLIPLAMSTFAGMLGAGKLFEGLSGLVRGIFSLCMRTQESRDLANLRNTLERINDQSQSPRYQDYFGNPVSAAQFFALAPPPYEAVASNDQSQSPPPLPPPYKVASLASAPPVRSCLVANTTQCFFYTRQANAALTSHLTVHTLQ